MLNYAEGNPEHFEKYPIHLLSGNSKEFLNGNFGNMPDNRELFGTPFIYLNPEDAEAYGIREGDQVRIYNDRGECQRIARIADGFIKKGHAQVIKSTWDKLFGVTSINVTTPSYTVDFGNGTGYQSNLVQIEKA